MYAFGYEKDDEFTFVQTEEGVVYTYPTEALAREYFDGVKHYASLYEIESDLSIAYRLESGDTAGELVVEPTEDQKIALWSSYVYKSMLDWAPRPEEVRPCLD
jgi:hypothetical protein